MIDEYIDQAEHLSGFVRTIADTPWLALDSEFVREDTYFPILCLLQIATPDRLALVDVCALPDLSPLFPLLVNPGCVKIMHSASQDLEVLYQAGAPRPANLFDTQIASALLGHPDQLGYAALVEKLIGIKLDKDAQRTDWRRRPLSAAQLSYAADDVRHFDRLYEILRAELEARGRLDWLWLETERLTVPARYQPDPDSAWKRLKGLSRAAPAAQTVARALATWREHAAVAGNRPRKWILADDVLYSLAQKMPQDANGLAATGLPPSTVRRHGEALLAQIASARAGPQPTALTDNSLSNAERTRLKALTDEVQTVATDQQIAPALLGTRTELERVLHGDSAALPLQGWRRSVIGERLLARLAVSAV